MQSVVEICDSAARVLAIVPFASNQVPPLSQLVRALPEEARPCGFWRFEDGIVNERQWLERAQASDNRKLRVQFISGGAVEPQACADDGDRRDPGSHFAIKGPRGDTVYPDKATFDARVEAMLNEGSWQSDVVLVVPPQHGQEYFNWLKQRNVDVLCTQGAIELWQEHHEYVAAAGFVGGFGGTYAAIECMGGRLISQVGGGFLGGLVAYKLVRFLAPKMDMDRYSAIMQKAHNGQRVEILRTTTWGNVQRELLLGKNVEEMLDKLVGQADLKEQVRSFARLMYMSQQKGESTSRQPRHILLKGNPGTGKTTVARILGKVFHAINLTRSDVFVEVQRADLVGEYVGHTAAKTRAVVQRAKGGVLFVDEAYRLNPDTGTMNTDFGQEAIEQIMQDMEKGDPLVIFAGYPAEMDNFQQVNPGLARRIQHTFNMQDYSPSEVFEIFKQMVSDRRLRLVNVTTGDFENLLERENLIGINLQRINGGAAAQLLASSQARQAERLLHLEQSGQRVGAEAKKTLTLQDVLGFRPELAPEDVSLV